MAEDGVEVIVGVDTHTAVAIDRVSRRLDMIEVRADEAGYRELVGWARRFGEIVFGVEGTGSYGSGLTRHLGAAGIAVTEVDRVDRQHRHRYGKSDPADAEAAARAVLSGQATGKPKSRDGLVESIRTLHVVKRSAIKARTQTANQMSSLIISAPDATREELRGLSTLKRARLAARCRQVQRSIPRR